MTNIIYRPCALILTAIGKDVTFVPYKENFTYTVAEGDSVQFEVKKAEEVMYYYMLASENLEIEQVASNSVLSNNVAHSTVTIDNFGDKDFHFVPFNQNFGFTVKAGDSLIFETPSEFADYYKKQEFGDVTITVQGEDVAPFEILTANCTVYIYERQGDNYVKFSNGETSGIVTVGNDYRFVISKNGGEVSVFRCNGVDLTPAENVEDAETVEATAEGFNIIAVVHGGDSSGSVAE